MVKIKINIEGVKQGRVEEEAATDIVKDMARSNQLVRPTYSITKVQPIYKTLGN